jgi:signal peptidase I
LLDAHRLLMDFSAALALLLAVAGLTWLVYAAFYKGRPDDALATRVTEPVLVHYAKSFFPVILIVLIIRSFIFEPFRIPSESMMPGLIDGDFIFVSKFAYGLRLPITNTKVWTTGQPRRGDVIVFRLPAKPSVHFIKRLIGLPGDHVAVRDNQVYINGSPLALKPDGSFAGGAFMGSDLELETIGGREHVIMLAADRPATDYDAIVPSGQYFFMGDNRNDSEDSRFGMVGFVPEQYLVGHAVRIWLNWDFPHWPNWRRVGMKIS